MTIQQLSSRTRSSDCPIAAASQLRSEANGFSHLFLEEGVETTQASGPAAKGEWGSRSNGLPGMVRELWAYRELFYFFAWRDIKVRYKQTILGVLWAVIQPLFTMVVFTILFGRLADIPTDGMPRPIFYLSALVPWTYFAATVSNASMSFVANSDLLTKIYFPRIILPASSALSGMVDFAIASLVLVCLLVYYDVSLGVGLLAWPAFFALLVILALSVGTILAACNVRYRDVKYALPFVVQLWLFVTPIIYPSSLVPEQYQWILALNPLTGIVEGFRYAVAPQLPMHWELLAISSSVTALLLASAIFVHRRNERTFADYV